jgi:hypothetical protein
MVIVPNNRIGCLKLLYVIRKAFDLLGYGILPRKLAEINVTKGFLLWTWSFVEGRSQQLTQGGTLLSIKSSPAGVPQGSVMSPTLYNVHGVVEISVPHHLFINTCKL